MSLNSMFYVYLIKSIPSPNQTYIGRTENIEQRLGAHNSGGSAYTAPYRPWELVALIGFKEARYAIDFELYLKTGAGRAFAAKRLWSSKN